MSIVLDRLSKRFGRQTVVDRVSLEVQDGELFVLLGASGSGKSTILRLIAGLAPVDEGRILLQGEDVTHLLPQRRGTGFVFQNYSIFRHMSVAENIEFGLKIRHVPAAERARKRDELLDLVGLMGLGSRYADQLSGGQLQRVALARALAYEPNVLLLDEPFGALDVRIRSQLRRSLKEIQRRLQVATILVTHDQEEAFELADRIAVLERGRLLEVGEPEALYSHPRSLSVATFVGGGTVLAGRAQDGQLRLGDLMLPIPSEVDYRESDWVSLLVRPEHVELSTTRPDPNCPVFGQGEVVEQTFAGTHRRLRLRLPHLPATRQIAPPLPFGEEGLLVDAMLPAEAPLSAGQLWVIPRTWHILAAPPRRLLVYDTTEGDGTALATAQMLGRSSGAQVTLLGVAESPDTAEPLREELERRREAHGLERAELRIRNGDPLQQIVAEQREAFYELLVLAAPNDGAGRAGRPERSGQPGRLGRLLRTLLDRPATPILIVSTAEADPFRRLLICTRAGEPGKSDVRVGGWLARRLNAAVTLLYVSAGAAEPAPWVRRHLDHAAATLRSMDVPVQVRFRAAVTPVEGILAEARDGDYDVTVLGSHGAPSRSALARDDVTLQIIARTHRSVLVVPAEE